MMAAAPTGAGAGCAGIRSWDVVRRRSVETDDAERHGCFSGELGPGGDEHPVISTFAAPKRIVAWRSTSFERQVWRAVVVINRYRLQSNGEIVLDRMER